MEDIEEQTEETAFITEDVLAIVKESVEGVLSNATYTLTKVPSWTSMCIEHTLKKLKQLDKPLKSSNLAEDF